MTRRDILAQEFHRIFQSGSDQDADVVSSSHICSACETLARAPLFESVRCLFQLKLPNCLRAHRAGTLTVFLKKRDGHALMMLACVSSPSTDYTRGRERPKLDAQ